ncbi:hypothetical protein MON38_19125 [Hymenobacter sp. DH14]|uniref:Uncharacterized protein n=1 Tax=Hymenobacter cyanobacteriorum TaxID=2926463 RepID=A0A9X1VIP0_9BACT|nr:hypothetical protein [Hymenobacter cyanobacteriorum]MCI1189541.1 hypothetical protein [Hymenobacter cyanobacteriorum]
MGLHPVKPLLLLLPLLLGGKMAAAQSKVAVFAHGQPGTAAYEQFSFWTANGQRTDIYYRYGKARREVKLRYAGPVAAGFRVQFSNGHLLTVVPNGETLRVSDAKTSVPKRFAWEYEGPINGIGTFCRECAADAKEAMRLVRAYYLK